MLSYTPQFFDSFPLSSNTRIIIVFMVIVLWLAVIANSTMIYIFIRKYKSTTTSHEKFVCLLLICELCWAFHLAIQYTMTFINGYSFNFTQCQWIGPLLPLFSSSTIFCHGLLALDRYHSIRYKKPMSKTRLLFIGLVFIPPILSLPVIPLLIGSGYILTEEFYCYLAFTSTKVEDRIPTLFGFGLMMVINHIIIDSYYRIYSIVPKLVKENKLEYDEQWQELNRKLFYTCVTVLGCFQFCFVPTAISLVLQTTIQYELPLGVRHFFSFLAVFDTLLTPLVLFYMMPIFQDGFKSYIYNFKFRKLSKITSSNRNGRDSHKSGAKTS
ncbi:hypothetical protein BC833DRAFT_612164 [Globomyces pollinis-pini]|nr:hypothetical protein BC833DRAFT_612164 [Globomyces pollinis-pini]